MAHVRHDDHDFLDDRRLSWKARGLLAFILKHRKGEEINVQNLIEESDEDGRVSVQGAFHELIKLKYAHLETVRDKDGRVRGKTYVVSRIPQEETEKQETCLSATEKQENRLSEKLSVGTDKQENRRTENMLVGSAENGVDTGDDRRAENPTIGKPGSRSASPLPPDPQPQIQTKSQDKEEGEGSAPAPTQAAPVVVPTGRHKVYPPADFQPTEAQIALVVQHAPDVDVPRSIVRFKSTHFSASTLDWGPRWVKFALDDQEAKEPVTNGRAARASPTPKRNYVEERREREHDVKRQMKELANARAGGHRSLHGGDDAVIDGVDFHRVDD